MPVLLPASTLCVAWLDMDHLLPLPVGNSSTAAHPGVPDNNTRANAHERLLSEDVTCSNPACCSMEEKCLDGNFLFFGTACNNL